MNYGICDISSGNGSQIENCYNAGAVRYAGIVGTIEKSTIIQNNYRNKTV